MSQRGDVKIGDSLSSGIYASLSPLLSSRRGLHTGPTNQRLETSKVTGYDFVHNGVHYTLIDTPGFDDTNRPDSEITGSILEWCRDSLAEGSRLNGVIYMHNISTPRMAGSAVRNVRIFRKLVGHDAFASVVLATTFWEHVPPADLSRREQELRTNRDFWGAMVDQGARIERLGRGDRASGLRLLGDLAAKAKVVLRAQEELVNQGKAVSETDAAVEEQRLQADEELARSLDAQRKAENERMARELEERQRCDREARLAMEAALQRQLEESRLARQRAEAAAMEAIRQQAQREAEARRREEEWRIEQYQAQRRAIELERLREEARRKAEMDELRLRYQKEYTCARYRTSRYCDSCGHRVKGWSYYYRKFLAV